MAGVSRLFRTTSRTVLPSLASSRAVAYRPSRFLISTRYNNTSVNASQAPLDSETLQSEPNSVDPLPDIKARDGTTDWSRSYAGLSVQPFSNEVAEILQAPIEPLDIEIKPGKHSYTIFILYSFFQDGLLYLPEIKYRRILNKAFGPGGWGLAPRSETNVGPKIVSREYALVCFGRLGLSFSPSRSLFTQLELVDWSPLLGGNRNISIHLALPRRRRPVKATR